MKVSFVIPAYNEEAIIAQCLESIQKEIARATAEDSYLQTEVVVVNNASTDNTKEVVLGFASIRVVDEPQKGLVSARSAGFRATHGELVANIDADVMLPQGWLTTVTKEFKEDEQLVALSGPFIYYDLPAYTRFWVKVFYGFGLFFHRINNKLLAMLQGGNFVIRRDAMEKVGGFDTSIVFYGEDSDVAKRLSTVGKVKWTFKLPVYSSSRRLKHEGIIRMSLRYTLNNIWMMWFNRPFSKTHIDIRPQ